MVEIVKAKMNTEGENVIPVMNVPEEEILDFLLRINSGDDKN